MRAKFRLFMNKQPNGYCADFIVKQPDNSVVYLRPLFQNTTLEISYLIFSNFPKSF